MKMKKILSISVVATLLLSSCNSEFSRDIVKSNISSSCKEKMAGQLGEKGNEYCDCAAEELMRDKSTTELMKLEKDFTSGAISLEQVAEMIKPCIDNLSADMYKDAKDPNSFYRKNFVKVCSESLAGQADAAKVSEYCNCSVEKIVNALTPEELKKMDQNPNDVEVKSKAEAAIQTCIEEFSK